VAVEFISDCFRVVVLEALVMPKNYWLVKQEPEAYSWADFVKDGSTSWTGVRNFQARNNLRAMKKGDPVFFYHSVSEKQIVGIAKVTRESYPDRTADEGDWSAVDLAPVKALKRPVSLEEIKKDPALAGMPLVTNSRLSVQPVTEAQAARILEMSAG
jgi:predicted RNA-binding protein with PUA-like domain